MVEERRVKCQAEPGIFDGEKIVTIPIVDSTGKDAQAKCLAYGDSVALTGEPNASGKTDAVLRAGCLGENKDYAMLVLPQSTLQNGPNVIVRKTDLTE